MYQKFVTKHLQSVSNTSITLSHTFRSSSCARNFYIQSSTLVTICRTLSPSSFKLSCSTSNLKNPSTSNLASNLLTPLTSPHVASPNLERLNALTHHTHCDHVQFTQPGGFLTRVQASIRTLNVNISSVRLVIDPKSGSSLCGRRHTVSLRVMPIWTFLMAVRWAGLMHSRYRTADSGVLKMNLELL